MISNVAPAGTPVPRQFSAATTGRSVRLQSVIALAFLLILLLSGSGIVWLNNRATLDLLHRQVGHQFDILANGLSAHVAMQFGNAEAVLDTLAMNPPSLADPERAGLTMAHLLADLRQISPSVGGLSTVTDDERYIAVEAVTTSGTNGPAYRLRIGREGAEHDVESVVDLSASFAVLSRSSAPARGVRDGTWSRFATEEPVSTSQHMSMRRDSYGLTLSRRAQSGPGQVFGVAVQLDDLTALLKQARVFEGEQISVFDARGTLLADSSGLELPGRLGTMTTSTSTSKTNASLSDALAFDQQSFAAFTADQKSREGMFRLPDGEVFASITSFRVDGGTVIVASSVPTRLFEDPASHLLFWSLAIEAGMLLIAGTVVAFTSRSISRPINNLAAEVERVINFDFSTKAPVVSRIREIQRLLAATRMLELTLKAFSTYLPHHFVREFLECGNAPALGGVRAPIIVMFSDIDGFTRATETMVPDDLMLQLSRYFAIIEEEVLSTGGTVDKFIGDGVMAFWPLDPTEAGRVGTGVCRAVLRAAERLDALNRSFADEGRPTLRTRFGLHAGDALVGNVGTTNRMNYTVLGHAVNIGSRIEQLNKVYGTQILASATVQAVADSSIRFRYVIAATIRGSQAPIDIFEVMQSRDAPRALGEKTASADPACHGPRSEIF